MEESKKIKFQKYGIEFDEEDFNEMNKEELEECQKILNEIKEIVKNK